MGHFLRIVLALLIVSIQPTLHAETPPGADLAAYPDPERFEKWIAGFLEADLKSPPESGGIVAVGSSSMRGWHKTILQDLAPLSIIPRGFGGSNMNDVLYFVDGLVNKHKPRAVLLYEGDNDVAGGIAPETILDTFRQLQQKIHRELPETRIYMLAVKPSIARWQMWPTMQRVNRLLKSACEKDDKLTFIDIASPMLNEQGFPKAEIFVEDMLHMNDKGYRLWKDAVKPILVEAELGHEK